MRRLPLLAALLSLLAASGCDGFLDEDVRSSLTDTNLSSSREGIEAAALNLQALVYDITEPSDRSFLLVLGTPTDDQIATSSTSRRQEMDLLTFGADNREIERVYEEHTRAIAQINTVIGLVGGAEVDDAAFLQAVEAEARFYRAFTYLRLVQLFGPVPVIREPYDPTAGVPTFTRDPESEVYALVDEDLAFARANLPEARPADERGRPTADAARMIAARAALARSQWAEAASAAREVVAGGRHSLYPDYLALFQYAGETADEHILQVVLGPTSSGRRVNLVGVDFTPGSGNPYGQAGYTNHALTPDLAAVFEEGDLRRASFYENGFLLDGAPQETPYGLPWTLKYLDPSLPPGQNDVRLLNYIDYSLIRYAEALLTLAEAANETGGPTAEAYSAVDAVRARAGLDPLPSGLSQGAFRDAVRLERRKELYFEGLRWFDLKRYGYDAFKAAIESSVATRNLLPITAEPKHLLFPIPDSEIAVTGFEQNPGY